MGKDLRDWATSRRRSFVGTAHFRLLFSSLLAFTLVGIFNIAAPAKASADAITIFALTGTFPDGASYDTTSTITVDTTLGIITDANITILPGTLAGGELFAGQPSFQLQYNPNKFGADWTISGNPFVELVVGIPTELVGYTGGALSLSEYVYDSPLNHFETSPNSTLSAIEAVPTPEPSSLLLFGTGLLGICGLALRGKRIGSPSLS